jgi:hypothetical protein
MSCPQCFSGHVNPGNPQGRFETVHGLRTYVAEPPKGKSPAGIVVIIPDAFGVGFVNNQILADHYASGANLMVYLPDFMDGKFLIIAEEGRKAFCVSWTRLELTYPVLYRPRVSGEDDDQHGPLVG